MKVRRLDRIGTLIDTAMNHISFAAMRRRFKRRKAEEPEPEIDESRRDTTTLLRNLPRK